GHKSTQLRGTERHTADLPYACRSYTVASAFLFVQTPATNSSGHKSTQLRGTERHTADLPYACRSYTVASAFLCCDFSVKLVVSKF
ncbi:hypothetical protein ACQKDB_02645, partial [Planococcus kocurii]|uniref:hypothetical protein n=1 Tax=Planococcus kocurii TaxID=1374 RepID=UPI003D07A83F